MRNIKQNLFWALAYNTIGIPIAALGILSSVARWSCNGIQLCICCTKCTSFAKSKTVRGVELYEKMGTISLSLFICSRCSYHAYTSIANPSTEDVQHSNTELHNE